MSSGQGAIPNWWYSPQAQKRMIWCNSKTNSTVWMREDIKQAYVKNCIICFTVFEIAPAKANHNNSHALCYFLCGNGSRQNTDCSISQI